MARFDEVQSSAHEASDMMEGEQMEKRELEEKLTETMVCVCVTKYLQWESESAGAV